MKEVEGGGKTLKKGRKLEGRKLKEAEERKEVEGG